MFFLLYTGAPFFERKNKSFILFHNYIIINLSSLENVVLNSKLYQVQPLGIEQYYDVTSLYVILTP